jgi:hypothetical protein
MAEAQGMVHMCRCDLLQGWWPTGQKFVYDQMAAPISELWIALVYLSTSHSLI